MYEDIPNVVSYDYQVTTPEVVPGYSNYYLSQKEDSNILKILRKSADTNYPYLGWTVDLNQSNDQPGCFSTCNSLADPAKPNSVYNYNACMDSCSISGTSSGIVLSSKPHNKR